MATGTGNRFITPFSISATGSANGKVRKQDKFDFYSFTLAGKSSFNATLTRLKGDANLALFNSGGGLVSESKKPRKKSEAIGTTLEAGTYVMRVSLGKNTKKTPYKMDIASTLLVAPIAPVNPVAPSNTAPMLSGSLSLAATRGTFTPSSVNLTSALLKAIDTQQGAGQLTYTLTNLPKHGNLFKNGVQLAAASTFTQADIDSGFLAYKQEAVTALPSSTGVAELAVSGSNAAWIAGTGSNQNVFFYNGTTGTTQQLTTTSTDYDDVQISGSTVVWGQYFSSGSEHDLFYSTNGATPIAIDGSSFDDSSPAISGTKIVFKRDDTSGSNTVNDGIQLFDITTGTTTALSSASDNYYNPKISGSLIAWERYFSGGDEYDVYYSTGGTGQTISGSSNFSDYSPAVSGTKIAFYRDDKSSTNVLGDGIYLFDTTTSSLTQLRSFKEEVYDPQISGSNVTWSSSYSGEYDVEYSVNGGSYQSVSGSSTLSDYNPQISGTKIAFYRDDLSGTNVAGDGIYLFDTNTTTPVQLSSGSQNLGAPLISGSNVFWKDLSSTAKALFYDGTTTADSFGFTVSDGSLTTNGTLNITIS